MPDLPAGAVEAAADAISARFPGLGLHTSREAATEAPGAVAVLGWEHAAGCLVARHPDPRTWETSGFPWCTCREPYPRREGTKQ